MERLEVHGSLYDRQLSGLPERFVRLRALYLHDNLFTETSVLQLRAMESLGRLEALTLKHNELPAASIPHDVWQEAWEEHCWEVFE